MFDLSLEGPSGTGTRVQFYGMLQGWWSVANVCRQVALELVRRVADVGVYSYNGPDHGHPDLAPHAHVHHRARVGMFHGFPTDITERFWSHEIRVGGFVCETDRISPDWVEVCNAMDLVYVPSRFCRQAFRDSGVTTPVMVVPHGIEPHYRPHGPRHRHRPLVFYDTFHSTSALARKGVDELIGCFLEAFGNSGTEARLVLRADPCDELTDVCLSHDFGDALHVSPLVPLDTAAFAALYGDVHCTVHPARGEGFGLVPLQSIACETPVIATAATGMLDYLDDTNALLLRTAGRTEGVTAGNQAGEYFLIDEAHLVELLRVMNDTWEEQHARVRRAAPAIRSRFAWPVVLDELVSVVGELAEPGASNAALHRLASRWGPSSPDDQEGPR